MPNHPKTITGIITLAWAGGANKRTHRNTGIAHFHNFRFITRSSFASETVDAVLSGVQLYILKLNGGQYKF
jgi:hypothetical protein